MASAILILATGTFMALIVIVEVSSQSETCALKAENSQCVQKSECCSRCCRAGLCSREGDCFAACDSNIIATAEGPDVCRLTKSIDEFVDLLENVVDDELAAAIPFLSDIIGLAHAFLNDPLAGFIDISNVIKHYQTAAELFVTSTADSKQIVDIYITIINECNDLIRKLISKL